MRFYYSESIEYVGCVTQYDVTYTNNSPSNVIPLTGWAVNIQIGKYLYNDSDYFGDPGVVGNLSISGIPTSLPAYGQQGTIVPRNRFFPKIDYFPQGTTLQLTLCGLGALVPYGVSRRLPTLVSNNTNIATVNNSAQTINFVGGGNFTIALTAVQDNDYRGVCSFLSLRSTNINNQVTYIYQFSGGSYVDQNSSYILIQLSGIRMYLNDWSCPGALPYLRSNYTARLSGTPQGRWPFYNVVQFSKNGNNVYGNGYPNWLFNGIPNSGYDYVSYSNINGFVSGPVDNTSLSAVSADYDKGFPLIKNIGTIY
jgi:hypothetical protein